MKIFLLVLLILVIASLVVTVIKYRNLYLESRTAVKQLKMMLDAANEKKVICNNKIQQNQQKVFCYEIAAPLRLEGQTDSKYLHYCWIRFSNKARHNIVFFDNDKGEAKMKLTVAQ